MKSILSLLNPAAGKLLRKVSYPKGHLLLQRGDTADKVWFVEEGIVREFFIPDGGPEVTTRIVTANALIYAPMSYLKEEPSRTVIEVIEKCRVIPVHKSEVNGSFLRAVLEQTLIRTEKHFEILRLKSPNQRLEAFERLYPELCNRISQYYVASLLNITPQTLSRIRSYRARSGPVAVHPVKTNFHPITGKGLSHFSNFVRFVLDFSPTEQVALVGSGTSEGESPKLASEAVRNRACMALNKSFT